MIEINIDWLLVSILIINYLITFLSSTLIVRKIVRIMTFLFSLELKYKQYLRDGKINEELRTAFKNNRHTLADDAKVSQIDEKHWEVVDGKERYGIEDTGKKLHTSLSVKKKIKTMDTGFVVGICENFIIITFILANEITGLALVFAAKTIVRYKDMSEFPEYYLIGTMVNFTFSLLMGVILKYIIIGG